jgi:progressive ankylosis protein
MASTLEAAATPITVRTVFLTWWPLAASWLLMGFELPVVSAVIARLPEPTLSLAAYGAVVFPIALMIESPIIMLLSASTALSKDANAYRLMRRFMYVTGATLTLVHVVLAFTPLYDWVIGHVMGIPAVVAEQGRIGLRIMTPWTLSIAYRRFQQGVLIRNGASREIGFGTAVRLGTNVLVLSIGYLVGHLPGIVVGTCAVALGVVAEAIYAGVRVRPVLRAHVWTAPPERVPLTQAKFMHFYLPLMMTPILMFFAMPLTSAAMSRMHLAIESLAVWPVIMGLVFTLRSVCFGLNEVVVAMLERPGAAPALRAFTWRLAVATSAALALLAITPLGELWFGRVSALEPDLVRLALPGLWISFLLPGVTAFQSLYQGTLVHAHRTRAVTESIVIYLATVMAVLAGGAHLPRMAGLYVGLAGSMIGNAAQAGWLWWRARPLAPAPRSAPAVS